MVSHVSLDDAFPLSQPDDGGFDAETQGASRAKPYRLTINKQEIEARPGDTILQAARRAGIAIPSMCDDPRLKPTGDCGLCVVEVQGSDGLIKACKMRAADGLVIETETPPLKAERKRVLDGYLSNHNAYCLPPCEYKCPAGIDVAGYIDLIVDKKYVEATALIKEKLPLPGVLGRVCPRPCESVCRRAQVDGKPVAICALKRYAADKALEDGRPTQPVPKAKTGKRAAVVGSGPAGLSAAYYLALEGHEVTILEALEQGGGTLRYGIPPYRLPHAVLDQEIEDILSLGVTLKTDQRMGRDYQLETLRNDGYDAVFLGIGAMVGKPAKIEGEDAPGVMPAVDFLLEVNRGKRVPLGDKVIVIGGGFTAADAVRTARRQGATNVTMMYRRTKKEMSAAAHEIHDCEVEGVRFDFLAAPVKVVVENGRATGLIAQRMELGEPDASGRRRPEPVAGSDYFTPADTILLAIGQDVDFAGLNEKGLAPSKWTTVNIDEATTMTNLPGVFAGGDCVTGAATVVEAVAAGRQGAFAIDAYFKGADEATIAKTIAKQKPKFFDIGAKPKSEAGMADTPVIESRERLAGFLKPDGSGDYDTAFAEVEHAFSDETAHEEAERCLQCRCQAAGTCSLQKYSLEFGAGTKMFKGDAGVFEPMVSWPFFELNREKCIRCMDCVRVCDEVQHRKVYTSDELGYPALVSGTFDFRDTECNNCGQCVGICPTGALKNLTDTGTLPKALRQKTTTICGYCGVGCAIDIETERGRVVAVTASKTSDANVGNLCVKGRFGMDFIHHPDRLKKPMIRRGGKNGKLEEATWPEAIAFVAKRFNEVKAKHGPHALGGLCSARATNEDNYVFQKLIRCAFGTNNIDHCARLCHMASAVALKISVGSSAPSASAPDVGMADAFIVVGSNTTETHPVMSSQVFRAKYNNGAKVVVVDPRRIEMVDHADVWLRPRTGTNVAVLNGIAHVILKEGLANEDFIAKRTEGWEAYKKSLDKYTPEYVSKVSDVPAERIVEAARIYGTAKRGMLLWGMGITQHLSGVDGALAMSNLSLITGHVGRPGTGFIPLRGQSNVQGCSDMQGQHNALPGYHNIKDAKDRAKFEKAWGVPMPDNQYKTVIEMEEACLSGEIKGMFIMGENPMGSSPDIHEVEEGLRNLDFLVVQDIFLSETAALADVVLPAASFAEKDGTFTNTERRVQLVRAAVAPPGQARPDWKIVCDIATAMGYKMSYPNAAAVMEEIASLVPSYAGIRHERLGNGGLQWPCLDTEHPGTRFLYAETFPTPSGRGNFAVVEQDEREDEIPDDKYPLTLSTGRLLEHYHTGTMTRRSKGLDHMKPEGEVEVHPEDARRYGLTDGCRARIVTKRGSVDVKVWVTERQLEGAIFYPFHFGEAPANRLVASKFDRKSFTPAFKRSAARIERMDA